MDVGDWHPYIFYESSAMFFIYIDLANFKLSIQHLIRLFPSTSTHPLGILCILGVLYDGLDRPTYL